MTLLVCCSVCGPRVSHGECVTGTADGVREGLFSFCRMMGKDRPRIEILLSRIRFFFSYDPTHSLVLGSCLVSKGLPFPDSPRLVRARPPVERARYLFFQLPILIELHVTRKKNKNLETRRGGRGR